MQEGQMADSRGRRPSWHRHRASRHYRQHSDQGFGQDVRRQDQRLVGLANELRRLAQVTARVDAHDGHAYSTVLRILDALSEVFIPREHYRTSDRPLL